MSYSADSLPCTNLYELIFPRLEIDSESVRGAPHVAVPELFPRTDQR